MHGSSTSGVKIKVCSHDFILPVSSCTHLLSTKKGLPLPLSRRCLARARGPAVPMGSFSCRITGASAQGRHFRGSSLKQKRWHGGAWVVCPRQRAAAASVVSAAGCSCTERGLECLLRCSDAPMHASSDLWSTCGPPVTDAETQQSRAIWTISDVGSAPVGPKAAPTWEQTILTPSFSCHSLIKLYMTCAMCRVEQGGWRLWGFRGTGQL